MGRFGAASAPLTPRLQPKLVVGPADDPLEREADRIADHVLSGELTSGVGALQEKRLERKPLLQRQAVLQRQCATCEEEEEGSVVRGKDAQAGPVADGVARAVENPSGGLGLAGSDRHFFEQRLGHRFDRVRIHDDRRAHELSASIGARAFTYGEHVFFGPGEYRGDPDGRRLLAHELTHTIQQGRSPALDRIPDRR